MEEILATLDMGVNSIDYALALLVKLGKGQDQDSIDLRQIREKLVEKLAAMEEAYA